MVQHTQPQDKSSIDSLANKPTRSDAETVVKNITKFKATEDVEETSSAFVKVMAQMNIDTRSSFDEMYEQRWLEASNESSLLSVLLCDIDFFQAYKENCGEQSTSFMLVVVALKLKNICDEYGCFLAYYQNDRFAVLQKGNDEKQALEVAEALRQAVEESKTEHKFSEVSDFVTLSIGVSSIYPTSMKRLIEQADESLQNFKKATLSKVKQKNKTHASIKTTTKKTEAIATSQNITTHANTLPLKEDVKDNSTASEPNESDDTNKTSKETSVVLNEAETKLDTAAKPVEKANSKEAPATLNLVEKDKAEKDKAETKLDAAAKPVEKENSKEAPATLNVAEKDKADTGLDTAAKPVEKANSKEAPTTLNVAEKDKAETKPDAYTKPINDELKEATIDEINISEEKASDIAIELNESPSPVKKKTIKRHINALKALVTKTNKKPKLGDFDSEKPDEIVLSTTESINEKPIAPEIKATTEPLKETPNEMEALTLEKKEDTKSNDSVPSLTKSTAPKSAIERHIAALKATKVEQKSTNTIPKTIDEQSEEVTSNSNDNQSLTIDSENETTQEATYKSPVERHIEALKASKKTQKTALSSAPVKDESIKSPVSENKIDDGLSIKKETEKSQTKAPKSAIERHIEAMKATKNKSSANPATSSKPEKSELTLAENKATTKAPTADTEVKKEDKPELTLTENKTTAKAPTADTEVKKEDKPELTLTENKTTTKAPTTDIDVKKEDKVASEAASVQVEKELKIDNETVREKTPVESKEETTPPKSAIQRHIESLKAAKSLSVAKNSSLQSASLMENKTDQVEDTAQTNNVQTQERTELQQRLLAEKVEDKLALDKKLKAIWQECSNEDELLSMVFAGVDFFKPYRESNGVQASENLLVNIASALRKRSDQGDTHIYHTGDQYFVILHKGGNATKTLRLAEKLRKGIEGQGIANNDSSVSKVVTLSLGLFSIFPDNTNSIGMLTAESEEAYDMAIRSGRNNTYFGWR